MREIALRPKARSDLEDIWNYTADAWSVAQAERYLRDLNRAFLVVAKSPERGRRYDQVVDGLRVYPSGRHLVCYFVDSGRLDIVRILHERMDVPSQLSMSLRG